jgi:ribonucleoside-diphosphate reductase alpha chain
MSSCYLNTVEDDLDHIFKIYRDNALMSKFSGGIGTDWSNIRSTGSLIKTINIPSQGVVPFLKIANDVTVAIARSGRRIGATCVYLENWHLDFEDFLELRKNTGDERRRTHDMNTASWVPDLFIKRVEANAQWTLFSPEEVPELHHLYGREFEKKYVEYEKLADAGKLRQFRRVSALQLWRKMLTMLFETGHPWITFKDACNLRSPQDHVGVIHNSNLCTEITLNNSREETAVCNIGSINLASHIKSGKLEREMLAETVKTAVRMLDNVIDITFYPTRENQTANQRHRPIGLGIMGFQDALYMLGLDFESDKAVRFGDESMEFIGYHAIMASTELAREKGTYSSYKGSKWQRGIFPVDTMDIHEKQRGVKIDVHRGGKLDWKPVRALVKKYGMRNSNTMAIAPTASISNINGCYPCIEPIYKNLYVKSNMNGEFTVINPYLIKDLKKLNLWGSEMVQKLKFYDGSVQKISEIPESIRHKYKEVFEIDPMTLIRIAAHRGKWIDQSQSFNIFVHGISGKQLSDIYLYAWKMGLKTTYYLRSMAASQVEKSTVDTAEFGATHKRELAAVADTAPSLLAKQLINNLSGRNNNAN